MFFLFPDQNRWQSVQNHLLELQNAHLDSHGNQERSPFKDTLNVKSIESHGALRKHCLTMKEDITGGRKEARPIKHPEYKH